VSAREAILARLGSTMSHSAIDAEAAALLIAPERPVVAPDAITATFLARLAEPGVGATVDWIDAIAGLPAAIAAYLSAQCLPHTLYLPPDPRLAACDWRGFTLHDAVANDEDAVLATARCGVAETASLVFETNHDAPMLPNFLALHHIVLVTDIVTYLEDAEITGNAPRAHYWVTGVSGTTDIEGSYVRGAHGPRFLHVISMRRQGVP
jgi:L-lactate dehydrogenase complex protein LldG